MTMFLFYFNFDNKQIITPQYIQISKQKISSIFADGALNNS